MFAIGFQLGSNNSAQKKQYTVVILADGTLIKNWGNRFPGNKTNELFAGKGQDSVLAKGSERAAIAELKKIYTAKSGSGEYDQLLISFQSVDLSSYIASLNYSSGQAALHAHAIVDQYRMAVAHERANVSPQANAVSSARVSDGIADFVAKRVSTKTADMLNSKSSKLASSTTSTTPAVDKKFTQVEARIMRPNGEQYRPRQIMGHTDVALLRAFREKGMYVRLAGPPGGGKTALAEAAFSNLITVNGHGDMTVAHFIGSYLPDPANGNSWVWHDGPLTRAMRTGVPLFVDEGTRIPTEVLNILFSVMDGRGALNVDDRPDLPAIHAIKGFYVIMGYNPETLGARALDEALISRFRVQIDVTTDHETAKALGVPTLAIRIAQNLQTRDRKDRQSNGPGVWVPQMRELLTYRDLIKMDTGIEFALATLVASCPRPEDIPEVLKVIQEASKMTISLPALGKLV